MFFFNTNLFSQNTVNSTADSLIELGAKYQRLENYPKALQCFISAAHVQSKSREKGALAYTNMRIGKLYFIIGKNVYNNIETELAKLKIKKDTNFNFALDYFAKSKKWASKNGDTVLAKICINSIAEVNNFKEAIVLGIKPMPKKAATKAIKPRRDSAYLDSLKQKLKETQDQIANYNKNRKKEDLERDSLYAKLTETIGQIAGYEKDKLEDSMQMENEKKLLVYQRDSALNAVHYEFEKKQQLAKSEKERQQLLFEENLKQTEIRNKFSRDSADTEARYRRRELERQQVAALAKVEQERKLARNRLLLMASSIGLFVFLIFSIVVFIQRNQVRKEKLNVEMEKSRSEELLLNILPAEVAEELKKNGRSQARRFERITVIFSDFKSFTQFSANISAEELVDELHASFKAFDAIMGKYGIEKIKTIGDSYMAASGMGTDEVTAVENAICAALEMQEFIIQRKKEKEASGEPSFEMRIGIHTGPVVAGIVGVRKFAYDIWGDTVNTASRMESSGEPGKVNISKVTFDIVKDDKRFKFTHRGLVMAKGKGEMEMYFAGYSDAAEKKLNIDL
jgi:class 3 adenylate cyclase